MLWKGAKDSTQVLCVLKSAFALGGIVYSLSETMALDCGIKAGLNSPETDVTFLAGIALQL